MKNMQKENMLSKQTYFTHLNISPVIFHCVIQAQFILYLVLFMCFYFNSLILDFLFLKQAKQSVNAGAAILWPEQI